MSDEKPWDDMTHGERVVEGRRLAAERRAAEARGSDDHLQDPPGAADNDAPPLEELGGDSVADPGETAAAERRRRLLPNLDPALAARITDEQLEEIELKAKQRAEDTLLKQALDEARETAAQHARVAAGLIPAEVLRTEAELKRMNEPIRFIVDVPLGSMPEGKEGIVVNGFMYRNGVEYTRPRHVYDSLARTMYLAHLSELMFELNNQDKPGRSAKEVLARTMPRILLEEPAHAA